MKHRSRPKKASSQVKGRLATSKLVEVLGRAGRRKGGVGAESGAELHAERLGR